VKKVVTMLTLGGYNPMYHLSEKSIRRYAERIGADFIKQDKFVFNVDWGISSDNLRSKQQRLSWIQKFYIFDLLKKYDRILYLDSDILVTPNAPDIFEAYCDEKTIYMASESKHSSDQQDILNIFSVLGKIPHWEIDTTHHSYKYYNSGVILFSRECHLEHYFNLDEVKKIFNSVRLLDQTYINYLIFKYHLTHASLDDKFNWTALFCDHSTRSNAYFIHHNHKGFGKNRVDTFRKDYYQIYQNDSFLEKTIETMRAQLFKIIHLKKHLSYRLKRLNPTHWRWLNNSKKK
jgi:lipopolysaccharide biosynthesis glycosyltransferase